MIEGTELAASVASLLTFCVFVLASERPRFRLTGPPLSDFPTPRTYLVIFAVVFLLVHGVYRLQRLAVTDRQKLFESDYASLVIDSTAG